jgi:uncharacterized membrane protein YhaH (DUF805 family)
VNWFIIAVKKYAVFSGRAQRSEYWFFVLFYLIIMFVLGAVDGLFGTLNMETGMGLLSGIFWLAMLLPCITVGVRRLHDTNHSGWWLLIGAIPLIGEIILLVFFVKDSDPGANRFGENPKRDGTPKLGTAMG